MAGRDIGGDNFRMTAPGVGSISPNASHGWGIVTVRPSRPGAVPSREDQPFEWSAGWGLAGVPRQFESVYEQNEMGITGR